MNTDEVPRLGGWQQTWRLGAAAAAGVPVWLSTGLLLPDGQAAETGSWFATGDTLGALGCLTCGAERLLVPPTATHGPRTRRPHPRERKDDIMWTERLTTALLFIVGAINLVPGLVAVAPSQMSTAYGISVDGADSADLTVLLRHRAVLLGLVGIGLLCAAFIPSLRVPAMIAGGVSMGTFLLFAYTAPELNSATMRVARIDIAAIALLAVAAVLVSRKNA